MTVVRFRSLIVFECKGKACAPPPVGVGGSLDGPPAGFRAATEEDKAWAREQSGKAVPPSWRGVVVSTDPKGVNGCILRGFDDKGRTVRMYSAAHTKAQAAKKYARVQKAAEAVSKLDKALARDAMNDPAAAATFLIRRLGMRPGSKKNTKAAKEAFGATTLEARHVTINPGGKSVTFSFIGKGGKEIKMNVKDPDVVAVVTKWKGSKQRRERLFDTTERDVNAYVDANMGKKFNAKDLRTLKATTMALDMVSKIKRKPKTKRQYTTMRNRIADEVAKQLGNTRSMALNSYINPVVFGALGEFA